MSAAAIFDLDRTLISGSSAPVFQRHLADAGLGGTHIPGMDAYYSVYERVGENPVIMQFARLAARSAKGWPVQVVADAAAEAAEELAELLLPYARILIAEHQAAGRLVAIATTSPEAWVAPLAERLGIHHVIASKWIDDGNVYTGEGDGPFLWGRAKAVAVAAWADEHDVDLRKSYAYSDSAYDVPMLRAVGNPVAVNPDPQLAAIAGLKGWPIRDLDVPPGVLKIAGKEIQDWLRPFNRPALVRNARFEIEGIENIPTDGSAIVGLQPSQLLRFHGRQPHHCKGRPSGSFPG